VSRRVTGWLLLGVACSAPQLPEGLPAPEYEQHSLPAWNAPDAGLSPALDTSGMTPSTGASGSAAAADVPAAKGGHGPSVATGGAAGTQNLQEPARPKRPSEAE